MTISQHVVNGRVPKGPHPYNVIGPELYKSRMAEPTMAEVDAMPYQWRRLVHEHGLSAVRRLQRKFRSAEKAAFSLMNLQEIDL